MKEKISLQDRVDWDIPVAPDLHENWQDFRYDLPAIQLIRIPRWLDIISGSTWEINCFIGASSRTYTAAVYLMSAV